jgi:hypothetical protein
MRHIKPHWVFGVLALLVTVAPRCRADAEDESDQSPCGHFLRKTG